MCIDSANYHTCLHVVKQVLQCHGRPVFLELMRRSSTRVVSLAGRDHSSSPKGLYLLDLAGNPLPVLDFVYRLHPTTPTTTR